MVQNYAKPGANLPNRTGWFSAPFCLYVVVDMRVMLDSQDFRESERKANQEKKVKAIVRQAALDCGDFDRGQAWAQGRTAGVGEGMEFPFF